jgi:hypothetical protein
MDNYYFMCWESSNPEGSIAYAPDDDKMCYELIPELDGKDVLPFSLNMKKAIESRKRLLVTDDLDGLKRVWMDYQPNSLAWPLMSSGMKEVVDNNLTGNEKVDWVSCQVKSKREKKTYYVLRFNELLDVLDFENTMFVSGTDSIIKPVFSMAKVKNFNLFMASTEGDGDLWKITPGIYVSEAMKKAIREARLTGIQFSKVKAV